MILGLFLILIVIVPYCIYLYIVNNQLKLKIENLKKENKEIRERKILKVKDVDMVPLTYISNASQPKKKIESNKKEQPKEKIETKEQQIEEMEIPIFKIKEPKQEFNNQENYLKNIIQNNNNIKPIELTEYEQEQENNAIISYQELKQEQNKKTFIINEKDEPEDFISNLKEFRNNLTNK